MGKLAGKIFTLAIIGAIISVLTGCNLGSQWTSSADAKEPTLKSAWIAYWDMEAGERDLQQLGKKLDKLSFFGAYFDKFDRLIIPPELSGKKTELMKKGKYQAYLSFVNDKQTIDDSFIMKDTEVLRRLLTTDAALERHVDDVTALALYGGYAGIEIDYERVWKDEQVAQSFPRFVERLYAKAKENNLKLRIILEPNTPFASVKFPAGPEYVVMLYNLHGTHGEPGPKANRAFIEKTIARMKALPGEKGVAFSTGGCLWSDNGRKRYLTEAEARSLAAESESGLQRDKESQCLVFSYIESGARHQVWYADVEALNYWISIARAQGINNISLWRVGGNIDISKLK